MNCVTDIPINRIRIDPERFPVRRRVCPRMLDQLVRAFRLDPASVGPILVWPDPESPGWFILVSGVLRLKAAPHAGRTHNASAVLAGLSEAQAATLALMELTRPGRRGSAWDTAQAVGVLHRRLGEPSVRALAERTRLRRTQVARYLRVAIELPEGDVREALHMAGIDSAALHRLPLDRLYAVAQSEHPRLHDRLGRLVEEIRARRPSETAHAAPQKPGATSPGSIALVTRVSLGIGLLLALVGWARLLL